MHSAYHVDIGNMFLMYFVFIMSVVYSKEFRIGHLSSNPDEHTELLRCTSNSSVKIITLPDCNKFIGVENAAVLRYQQDINVLVGVNCEEESRTIARLAERWNLLYITTILTENLPETTCSAEPLNPRGFAGALTALSLTTGWKDAVIVCPSSQCEFSRLLGTEITTFGMLNITHVDEMRGKQWKYNAASSTRVIIFCLNHTEFAAALYRFQREIVNSEEFVFVLVELTRVRAQEIVEEVKETLYEMEVQHKHVSRLLRRILIVGWEHIDISTFSDSIPLKRKSRLLCEAIQILERKFNNNSSTLTRESLSNSEESSHVFFSSDGYSQPFLEMFGIVDGQMTRAGRIVPTERNCTSSKRCVYHRLEKTSMWPNVAEHLKVVDPECGYDGKRCSHALVIICSAIIFLLIFIPLVLVIRCQWKESRLLKMPWRIEHEKLSFKKEEDHPGYRRISTASNLLDNNEQKEAAFVNNERVYIRKYAQKRTITFSRKEMERLNQLKYLSHVNVNSFVGLVFNQNFNLIVAWTFCARGSLDDLIFRGARELGRDFKALFIKHILNGLQYIQKSAIKVHGALFLKNCVVDNYWIIKLTDFGLSGILKHKMEQKEIVSPPSLDMSAIPRDFLQYPPEYLTVLIETGEPLTLPVSTAGDMYQLGMLLYQILLTRRPFRERHEEIQDITAMICNLELDVPLRPLVPEPTEYTLRLISIMQQCWQSNPLSRPQTYKVVDAVAREFSGEKGSLIDHMIKMIDVYSQNLEDIVSERTASLTALQERTEELLFRMLPRTVAEELRDGNEIRPRMHEGVALLVADMWRFSNICNDFIPIQVVGLLHHVYQQLDKILDNFPATKIENVGDTYLVIAGIPKEPGFRQLETICMLALQFREFISNFIPDVKSDYKVQMKFGVNCGDVASGILGYKTPRFCVFGDAVAMTYRMAETSFNNRIQMTEVMYNQVTPHFPKFTMTQRGIVEIKTKGPITTYFLDDDKQVKRRSSKDPNYID